ncbi:hypothetical protein QEO94_11315 [Kingella negevensis]|uniref:phage tail terminator protein n=1 Tax=Kingella negevensis TaxID=1522312 RepID=UPI002543D9EF|nr:hypothetical protein [Kingella negevensis]WII93188.1 hypothetical protein QEO94_11315 [Kingella negevensis]
MTKPPKNMLESYPLLIARLKELPELQDVQGVRELSLMLDNRDIVPQDNTFYVVLDGWQPEKSAPNQLKKMRLSFSLVLAKQYYGALEVPHEWEQVGETLTAIRRQLQGWQPTIERNGREIPAMVDKFDEVSPASINYFDGFALYPLRFETVTL